MDDGAEGQAAVVYGARTKYYINILFTFSVNLGNTSRSLPRLKTEKPVTAAWQINHREQTRHP